MVMLPTTTSTWTGSVSRAFSGKCTLLWGDQQAAPDTEGRKKLLDVEHLQLVPRVLCCHRGVLAEAAGKVVCCFGLSGFEPSLLPRRIKGSPIRLDQGTDDTQRSLC